MKKWIKLIFEWAINEKKSKITVSGRTIYTQMATNESEVLLSLPLAKKYAIISRINQQCGVFIGYFSGLYFTLDENGNVDHYEQIASGTRYRHQFNDTTSVMKEFVKLAKR